MKKKKALSLVMAAVLAMGIVPGVSVWAKEQSEMVNSGELMAFSDSPELDQNEIVGNELDENGFVGAIDAEENTSNLSDTADFETHEGEENTDKVYGETGKLLDYQTGVTNGKDGDHITNIINYNEYYSFNDLSTDGQTRFDIYRLELNFPQNGRARIVLSDFTLNSEKNYFMENYYYTEKDSVSQELWETGEDSYLGQWITVKNGKAIFSVSSGYYSHLSINRESKVKIEYEALGTYAGEIEDNDSLDTANSIENHIKYNGNYSKYNDCDYYKFTMEQSGVVELNATNQDYTLYEEDDNGNVYKVEGDKKDYYDTTKRVRLPAGNYFIMVKPDSEYTVYADWNYESPTDYEQEYNNVKSQANEKQTNHWYIGNMNWNKDVDCYKMTITELSYLALELKIPRQISANSLKIALYDSNMKDIICNASNTENPYLRTNEVLCSAGTYYVRVENDRGYSSFNDYSFNLNQRPYKYVTAIGLPANKTVTEGESFTLTPEITPSDAEDPSVTWSSSNPYVATVDEKGNVTAKAVGTTDIVVTAADRGTVSATCTLTVQERVIKYVTEIGIAGEKSVKQGTAFSVAPVITPGDAENKALRWQSSNPAVVEVDSNGNMMANRCGTARITVTAQDRDMVSASCVVTVYNTVRYNLNGGTNNGGNPSTFYGNTTNLLNPTRRGYTFSGWYSDKGFKKKVTQITSGNVGNTTFYAKWKKVSVGKTTITSFANKSGKKALVKYKAVSGASGYEIVYSTDKKVKKNRTTVKTKAKSRTLKGLKKGKTYYVKVRAYKTDSTGLVVYGKYSAIKKVKIKK